MADNENSSFKNLDEGLAKLESVVKQLEDNSLSIDDAIGRYTEGMRLAVECRRSLNQLTQHVTEVRREAMQSIDQLNAMEGQVQSQIAAQTSEPAAAASGQMNAAQMNAAPMEAMPTDSAPMGEEPRSNNNFGEPSQPNFGNGSDDDIPF